MLHHVTLAAFPGHTVMNATGGSCTKLDIVIDTPPGATGDDVCRALSETYGPAVYTVAGRPLGDLSPGRPPFANGAVIVCSSADDHGSVPPSAKVPALLAFVVCCGPDSGTVRPLQRGVYTIGRLSDPREGDGTLIHIADPALSQRHARLEVGTASIILRDLRSSNGTWVDGKRIRSTSVSSDSIIRLGTSTCVLTVSTADTAGPPRRQQPLESDVFAEPVKVALQTPDQGPALLLAGALLPLALGIVLAVLTGTWYFLAFSSLSLVTAFVTLAGTRRRRRSEADAIRSAAASDRARRRAAAPDPGALAIGHPGAPGYHGAETGYCLPSAGTGRCPVRLGETAQPANIKPVPDRPAFLPPLLPDAPLVLMLGEEDDISFAGSDAAGLGRTAVLHASAVAAAGGRITVVCAGPISNLEKNARFLPGTSLLPLPEDPSRIPCLMSALPVLPGDAPQVLFLCVYGAWAEHGEILAAALPDIPGRRVTLLRFGGPPGDTHIEATGGRAMLLRKTGESEPFLPDLIGRATFERLTRALGPKSPPVPHSGPERAGTLPSAAAFTEVHKTECAAILGNWSGGGQDGACVVGLSVSGPLTLDLVGDGPHFLVAGTTGSGKSEFLRAFLAGLALAHSPNHLTMLLVDFKGGSGLGPLAGLPHCVGLLTDLSAENISRALVSLRAEVRRREGLFAATGTDSLSAYNRARPGDHAFLPRLLVVIDEFRMLAETVPTALPELLRIAAIGRSLGVHLILATQRPQGAITADIRANIGTSIVLRVQSPAESRDVMGLDDAADIPPGIPGRGYLRKSSSPPVLFQGLSTTLAKAPGGITIRQLDQHLNCPEPGGTGRPVDSRLELHRICAQVCAAADAGGYPVPFRPLQQPLPHVLARDVLKTLVSSTTEAGKRLVLGLLDQPEHQSFQLLAWDPALDSHVAVLGPGGSGSTEAVDLLATEHLRSLPGRHLYVLDASGGLDWTAAAPQTGAYVGPNDAKRAARVLAYLAGELIVRLSSGEGPPASGPGGRSREPITLLVTGWGRWCRAFRQGRYPAPEDDLADLVRDGESCGVAVILSGDRELLSSRFFPLVPNRLFFPTGTPDETLLTWPRLPPMAPVPGRVLSVGRIGTASGASGQILAGTYRLLPHQMTPLPDGTGKPHQIKALPALVSPASLAPAEAQDFAAVGVGGDGLSTVHAHLPPGSVFLVLGERGSGRTGVLRQLARSMHSRLICRWVEEPQDVECGDGDLSRTLLLVDDADRLPPALQHKLPELQSRGARIVISVVSGYHLSIRVPVTAAVRSRPLGALLRHSAAADADLFGVRIDGSSRWPPGRCVLIGGSVITEIQAAFGTD